MKTDIELNARERMFLDLMDIRQNFGSKYNEGMKDAIKYAKTLSEYAKKRK